MYAKRYDCRYAVQKKFNSNDLAGNDQSYISSLAINNS